MRFNFRVVTVTEMKNTSWSLGLATWGTQTIKCPLDDAEDDGTDDHQHQHSNDEVEPPDWTTLIHLRVTPGDGVGAHSIVGAVSTPELGVGRHSELDGLVVSNSDVGLLIELLIISHQVEVDFVNVDLLNIKVLLVDVLEAEDVAPYVNDDPIFLNLYRC